MFQKSLLSFTSLMKIKSDSRRMFEAKIQICYNICTEDQTLNPAAFWVKLNDCYLQFKQSNFADMQLLITE